MIKKSTLLGGKTSWRANAPAILVHVLPLDITKPDAAEQLSTTLDRLALPAVQGVVQTRLGFRRKKT
jgi:hypothetical protein